MFAKSLKALQLAGILALALAALFGSSAVLGMVYGAVGIVIWLISLIIFLSETSSHAVEAISIVEIVWLLIGAILITITAAQLSS